MVIPNGEVTGVFGEELQPLEPAADGRLVPDQLRVLVTS